MGTAAEKTDWGHAEDGHVVSPTTSHIRREATVLKGQSTWCLDKEDAGRQVRAFPAPVHGSPEVPEIIHVVDRRWRLFGM